MKAILLLFCFLTSFLVFSQTTLDQLTGFTGDLRSNNQQIGSATLLEVSGNLFLVSAKHVLDGWQDKPITYTFYSTGKADDGGNTINILLSQSSLNKEIYFSQEFDVAAIHLGILSDDKSDLVFHLFDFVKYDAVNQLPVFKAGDIWPNEDLALGIKIFTLGFPSELDRSSQIPVTLVSGITSGFYQDGTIKCQLPVYGGNSGGPVFAYSPQSPGETRRGRMNYGENSAYLLGITTSFVPYVDGTKSARGNAIILTTNSGFAKIQPISRVLDLITNHILSGKD